MSQNAIPKSKLFILPKNENKGFQNIVKDVECPGTTNIPLLSDTSLPSVNNLAKVIQLKDIIKKTKTNESISDHIQQYEFFETPFALKLNVPILRDVKMVMGPTIKENKKAIIYGLRKGQNLYLRGNTGTGKTNIVLFTMAEKGVPVYEINGEETMDEGNLIGRTLPRLDGKGFEWVDGKAAKAIKPVVQVPLPFLEKPAKADLLPKGSILNVLETKRIGEYSWLKVQDPKGKTGWVLSSALSTYKTPSSSTETPVYKEPNADESIGSLRYGDILKVTQEKKVGEEAWSLIKIPQKDPDNLLETKWVEGWMKNSHLKDVTAAKYITPFFDEPQPVKKILEPGIPLYWQERLYGSVENKNTAGETSKISGDIIWSRIQIPDAFNSAGEEGYLPDFAPDPKSPFIKTNFIRAGALLIDESNLILPGVKKRLNSLTDHRRTLVIDENRNERIKRHPTSIIFNTGNPLSYSSREQESADYLARFHVINFEDYNAVDYSMILSSKSNLNEFVKLCMILFHMKMIENGNKGIIGRRMGPYVYSTRDLMKLSNRVNKDAEKVTQKLDKDTQVFRIKNSAQTKSNNEAQPSTDAKDVKDLGGIEPGANEPPLITLKAGDEVKVISHEEYDGAPWTLVELPTGKLGFINGKTPCESLFQLIWKEAREVYIDRIAEESERNTVETDLSFFFKLSNRPSLEKTPVIHKLDNDKYQFGDIVLPINQPGCKDVPDKENTNLIINDETPFAAKRVAMIAKQIYHTEDTMLVGPTASGKTSYPSYVAMCLNRNLAALNASDQTDKTRFIGKPLQKRGGGQFDFEWQNGLFTEAIIPKTIRPAELYREPGGESIESVPQNTPLYYMKEQKNVNGEKFSLVQRHEEWLKDREQVGNGAVWVKDKDIQSDIIMIDEGNAARSGSIEGANSLFDKNRRYLLLEDFDGRKVYAHPSLVIFYTGNPPEYAGLQYTGVNQISPAARNRFTEKWFPEISPTPTAANASDSTLVDLRKQEDEELKVYAKSWLKNLPNKEDLAKWCVEFYREVRNKAAMHYIGAKRHPGEPLIYTIRNLKELAKGIVEYAKDEVELINYIMSEIKESSPPELEEFLKRGIQNGIAGDELETLKDKWFLKEAREKISLMTPEDRLVIGAKGAFVIQALHEFADDLTNEDKDAVKMLIQKVVKKT